MSDRRAHVEKRLPLPEYKMSAWLKAALEDIDWAVANKHRAIMYSWCESDGYRCDVCLAGAIMLRRFRMLESLKHRQTTYGHPSDLEERSTINALLAVDSMRAGAFVAAYRHMYGKEVPRSGRKLNAVREALNLYKSSGIIGSRYTHDLHKLLADIAEGLEAAGL